MAMAIGMISAIRQSTDSNTVAATMYVETSESKKYAGHALK